jgi:hypothetical protein
MARQGVRPTSSQSQHSALDETANDLHSTEPTLSPTNGIITKLVSLPSPRTQQNHSDLTGGFPVASHANNSYCLVIYSCNANYIHVEAIQSRNSANYVNAYRRGIGYFKDHRFVPCFERLGNEPSSEQETYCRKKKIQVQYVPPGNHRANQAERAIRIFKSHFIAVLATVQPSFPLQH